jgi:hypothetical protein
LKAAIQDASGKSWAQHFRPISSHRIAAPRLAPTYRQTEDTGRIAECVRVIREETKRQTEILGLIEREQAIENRAHHERDRS